MTERERLLESKENLELLIATGQGSIPATQLAQVFVAMIDHLLEHSQEIVDIPDAERPLKGLSNDDLFQKAQLCVDAVCASRTVEQCAECGLESKFRENCYSVLLMELAYRAKEKDKGDAEWVRKPGLVGWITCEYECSKCKGIWVGAMNPPRYCGHCGARMRNGG